LATVHDAGYKAGRKIGKEKEEKARKNRQLEGYELGMQDGKEEERKKWLMEGHGTGLCLTVVAHARKLFHGAILLEEAETLLPPSVLTPRQPPPSSSLPTLAPR
jgi:hypothetical protein